MLQDDHIHVRHALDAARKCLSIAGSRGRPDLDKDELVALSLERLLEIIGQAASRVSDDFRGKHPDIPWKKMARLNDRLSHGYEFNLDMVWGTAKNDLPMLIMGLKRLAP